MNVDTAMLQGTVGAILLTAVITTIVVGVWGKKLAELALALFLRPWVWLGERLYAWLPATRFLSLCTLTSAPWHGPTWQALKPPSVPKWMCRWTALSRQLKLVSR